TITGGTGNDTISGGGGNDTPNTTHSNTNLTYTESIQAPIVILTGDLFQATVINAKPGGNGAWTGASSGSFTLGAGGTFSWSFPWIYGPGYFTYNLTFDTGNSLTYSLRVLQKYQGNTTTNTVVTDTTVVTTNTAYIDTTATVDTGVITLVSTGGISVLSTLDLFVGSTTTFVTVVDDDNNHDTSYWTDPLGDSTVVTGTDVVVGEQDGVNSTEVITAEEILGLDTSWLDSSAVSDNPYGDAMSRYDGWYVEGGSKGNLDDSFGYCAI
ncbi:MAG: hypothetical protein EBU01_09800, partial [Crocinitomicaceae bacterium]|nr:hypothetical protein [Crocinitomicaceae bacterium]